MSATLYDLVTELQAIYAALEESEGDLTPEMAGSGRSARHRSWKGRRRASGSVGQRPRSRAVAGPYDRPAKRVSGAAFGTEAERMARFEAWCFTNAEEGRWGREILLGRCHVCGAEEYTNVAGRSTMVHIFGRHHATQQGEGFMPAPPKKVMGDDYVGECARRSRSRSGRAPSRGSWALARASRILQHSLADWAGLPALLPHATRSHIHGCPGARRV